MQRSSIWIRLITCFDRAEHMLPPTVAHFYFKPRQVTFYFEMASSKVLICILLVRLTHSFDSTQLSSFDCLVAEVKKLGQDLVLEAGCVEFWFLEICYDNKPFAGNLLERLIREEPFSSNPKIILSESGEVNFRESKQYQPTLVFLVFGDKLQVS